MKKERSYARSRLNERCFTPMLQACAVGTYKDNVSLPECKPCEPCSLGEFREGCGLASPGVCKVNHASKLQLMLTCPSSREAGES